VLKRVKYNDDGDSRGNSSNSDDSCCCTDANKNNLTLYRNKVVNDNYNNDDHQSTDQSYIKNNNVNNIGNNNHDHDQHSTSNHNIYTSNKHHKPRVVSTQVLLNAIRNIACGLPNAASFRMSLNDVYIRSTAYDDDDDDDDDDVVDKISTMLILVNFHRLLLHCIAIIYCLSFHYPHMYNLYHHLSSHALLSSHSKLRGINGTTNPSPREVVS
jgi:hypothetical protein